MSVDVSNSESYILMGNSSVMVIIKNSEGHHVTGSIDMPSS